MSHQNCSFLSAVLKSGLAVPLLCHPPLSWGSDTQLLQQQGKAATGQTNRGTEQLSLGSAGPGLQGTGIQGQDFPLWVSGVASGVRLQSLASGIPLNSTGLQLPAVGGGSGRTEPPPGPMEWGSQGMLDLEQLVTAHLQQAGQGVLSINHQERV